MGEFAHSGQPQAASKRCERRRLKAKQARTKPALIGWFVGQVMKATAGKANPQAVNGLLRTKLGGGGSAG